jgi:hypothetical protein
LKPRRWKIRLISTKKNKTTKSTVSLSITSPLIEGPQSSIIRLIYARTASITLIFVIMTSNFFRN